MQTFRLSWWLWGLHWALLGLGALFLVAFVLPEVARAPWLFVPLSVLGLWGFWRALKAQVRQPLVIALFDDGRVEVRGMRGVRVFPLADARSVRLRQRIVLSFAGGEVVFGGATGGNALWDFLALVHDRVPEFTIDSQYIALMISQRRPRRGQPRG